MRPSARGVSLTVMETFQIPLEAAEIYETRFVPALFGEWAPVVVAAAGVGPGHSVLDVACGTGVVARAAADLVGDNGRVVGVDLNQAMLTVAERLRPDVEWRQGDVAALPFPDGAFDVVVCQAALMFFPDVGQALRELARVTTSGGTIGVQVFASLDSQPGYRLFVEIAQKHVGPEAMDLLGVYWRLGDLDNLVEMLRSAGLAAIATETRMASVRMDSIDDFVTTEVESTPLAGMITALQYEAIRKDCRRLLAPFVTSSGIAVPISGHVVTAHKP